MPQIYGQLQNASLEVLPSDPTSSTQGRIWFNSTTLQLMVDNGTSKVSFLAGGVGTTLGDMLVYTPSGFQRLGIGTNGKVLTADSTQTLGLNWENLPATPFDPQSMQVKNAGLSATVDGSGNLVISLLTQTGATPSSATPVIVPFRNSSATNPATWAQYSVTSATTTTLPATATLGLVAGGYVWVYGIYDGTTFGLAVQAGNPANDGVGGVTATTLNTSSNLLSKLYSSATTATASVCLIGRVTLNTAPASTWPTPANTEVNPIIRYAIKEYVTQANAFVPSVDSGTAPTLGVSAIRKITARRDGQMCEAQYVIFQSAAGTAGSGLYLFPLPTGFGVSAMDAQVSLGTPTVSACGIQGWEVGVGTVSGTVTLTSGGGGTLSQNFYLNAKVYPYDTNHFYLILESLTSPQVKVPFSSTTTVSLPNFNTLAFNFATAGLTMTFNVRFPVAGWCSFGP